MVLLALSIRNKQPVLTLTYSYIAYSTATEPMHVAADLCDSHLMQKYSISYQHKPSSYEQQHPDLLHT